MVFTEIGQRLLIFVVSFISLHQDISYRCLILVSTRDSIVMSPSCSKPNSGVRTYAVIFVVSNDADSSFAHGTVIAEYVETFPITTGLQGAI